MMLMNATLDPASMEELASTSSTDSPVSAHLEHMVSVHLAYVHEYTHRRMKLKTAL